MHYNHFDHSNDSTREACGISKEREDEMQAKLDEIRDRMGLAVSKTSQAVEVLTIAAEELSMTSTELTYSALMIGRLIEINNAKRNTLEEVLDALVNDSETEE
jgi:hypothetical protein